MNKIDISDEELMIDAKAGNLDSIGILYQRYSKRLYNFFLRLTNNRETSSDLIQNLFYRVIKYRNSYNSNYQFKTWMYQMARNCIKDQYEVSSKNQHEEINLNDHSKQFEENTAEQQTSQDALLFKAIERLPDENKELIVLSKFQGLKYEEISQITGDSIPNIKVKVHRTMIKLKELYFEIEKQYN